MRRVCSRGGANRGVSQRASVVQRITPQIKGSWQACTYSFTTILNKHFLLSLALISIEIDTILADNSRFGWLRLRSLLMVAFCELLRDKTESTTSPGDLKKMTVTGRAFFESITPMFYEKIWGNPYYR
jgi:hypothetical protein